MAPQTPAAGNSGFPENTAVPVGGLADAATPNENFDLRTVTRTDAAGPDNEPFPADPTRTVAPETRLESTPAGAGVANQARPIPAAQNDAEGVVLSDGRRATFRALKGRDAMKAHERAGGDGEKTNYVLAAMATKIDGRPIVLEDLEELTLADFFAIVNGYGEKNGQ